MTSLPLLVPKSSIFPARKLSTCGNFEDPVHVVAIAFPWPRFQRLSANFYRSSTALDAILRDLRLECASSPPPSPLSSPSNIFSKLDQTFPYTLCRVYNLSRRNLSPPLSLSLHARLPRSFLAATSVFFDGTRVAAGCRERDKQREREREFLPTRCSRPNRFIRRQRASSPVIKTLTEAAAERSKAFRSRRPASSSKLSAKWFTRYEL